MIQFNSNYLRFIAYTGAADKRLLPNLKKIIVLINEEPNPDPLSSGIILYHTLVCKYSDKKIALVTNLDEQVIDMLASHCVDYLVGCNSFSELFNTTESKAPLLSLLRKNKNDMTIVRCINEGMEFIAKTAEEVEKFIEEHK